MAKRRQSDPAVERATWRLEKAINKKQADVAAAQQAIADGADVNSGCFSGIALTP